MVDRQEVIRLLNEEVSRGDVRDMISSAMDDIGDNREFKKAVKNIVADAIEEFLDNLWKRKAYWKGMVKRN